MRWKRVLGIGFFLIVAFSVAIYVVLETFDYNKLKPQVAAMVKKATGRDLHLGGEVDFAIGIPPSLVVTDAALANASWGSQPLMLKIDRLYAQVQLWPLLFRDVNLKHIGLEGVRVLHETNSEGQGNWNFASSDQSVKREEPADPIKLDIDNIRIEKLQFTFRNGQTGSAKQFSLARLNLAKQHAGDLQTIDLQTDYNDQPIVITGTTGLIDLLLAHRSFPMALSGKVANANIAIDGAIDDVLSFKGVDLKLNVSGQDLSKIGSIIGEKLPATDNYAVQGQLTGSAKALSLKEAHGSANRNSLNLTVNGQIKNLLAFSGVDLKVKGSGKDLAEIGTIIDQTLPRTDQFTVQARLIGSKKTLSVQGAQGTAKRDSLDLSLSGGLAALPALKDINFEVKASGKELAEIGPLVGTKLPDLGPFDMRGKLAGSARALTFSNFSAVIDKSDFKGQGKVEFHQKPKIAMRLESSVVDFTPLMLYLENDKKPLPTAANEGKRRLFPDTPLRFDNLQKVNADIVLSAENIHAKDARFHFGHLSVKIEDHDFNIDKFEAKYKETKISGNLHIKNGTPPVISTAVMVQDFDLGGLLKETGVSDQVRANIDIAAHLNSEGDSIRNLMAHLDGSIGAVMGEGYLTKYLDMLSVNLTEKVMSFWGEQNREQAEQIKCAVVQFDIKDGVATSEAFVFDSQILILTGEGETNLGTEQVDFLLVPQPKKPGILQLPVKLKVDGTIMEPKVKADKLIVLKKGAAAAGALAVGPLGLLAPFADTGAHKAHPCDIESIGQLGLETPSDASTNTGVFR